MLLQNIFCAIPQKNSVFYFKCRVLEYKEQVYINRSYLILVAEQVVVKNTLSIIDMWLIEYI